MEIIHECRRISREKVCLNDTEKRELKEKFNIDADRVANVKASFLKISDQLLAWKFLNYIMERGMIGYSSMSGYKNLWAKHYDRQYKDRPNRQSTVVIRHNLFEEILTELKHISETIDLIYHEGCG